MSESNMPRFSDQELSRLRDDFEEHKDLQEKRWLQLADMIEQSADATQRLAHSVESIAINTQGVVDLYIDIRGAARVGVSVQKFITWLAACGALGAIIATVINHALDI